MGKGVIIPILHALAFAVCMDQGIRLSIAGYPIGIWIWPVLLGSVVQYKATGIIYKHHKAEKGD